MSQERCARPFILTYMQDSPLMDGDAIPFVMDAAQPDCCTWLIPSKV